MPHHYRLSAKRRDISLDDIYEMTDQEAIDFIAEIRWGSKTKQVCPECSSYNKHYYKRSRKQWLCKDCGHTFSLTSNTVFAYRKISCKQILKHLFTFCNSAKGNSSIELSGMYGETHISSWLINQKIREGLLRSRDESMLKGHIHIDGGYFGGKRRHGRKRRYAISHKHYEAKIASKGKKKIPLTPVQKRNLWKRINRRRLIINLREVSSKRGVGAIKTRIAVVKSENEKDILNLCERFVKKGSTIWTDEHKAYKKLNYLGYDHHSVEHSEEFMTDDGVHNNQAESYFSRLRRAEYGVFHGMWPEYLIDYGQEMAWKEDMRKESLKTQLRQLIHQVFSVGESVWWRGYYQGHKRNDELMGF